MSAWLTYGTLRLRGDAGHVEQRLTTVAWWMTFAPAGSDSLHATILKNTDVDDEVQICLRLSTKLEVSWIRLGWKMKAAVPPCPDFEGCKVKLSDVMFGWNTAACWWDSLHLQSIAVSCCNQLAPYVHKMCLEGWNIFFFFLHVFLSPGPLNSLSMRWIHLKLEWIITFDRLIELVTLETTSSSSSAH